MTPNITVINLVIQLLIHSIIYSFNKKINNHINYYLAYLTKNKSVYYDSGILLNTVASAIEQIKTSLCSAWRDTGILVQDIKKHNVGCVGGWNCVL